MKIFSAVLKATWFEKENNPINSERKPIEMHGITSIMRSIFWIAVFLGGASVSDGRVAGKIGIYTNNYSGKSSTGINEEIIWVSIGMGITIAILITIALCYILVEKCKSRRNYFVNT